MRYILSYRLPGESWHDGSRVALQDAQRALRIIRQREKRVNVLGFSAGGHLLGMAVTRADERSYTPLDALDSLPARADGAALIYPNRDAGETLQPQCNASGIGG
ncbi:twin-arginine translocation pathway signal sequence domain protein [Kluyvera georgiana ATCC 51603]|uniref:Twin-arginine translocation pathway signal sequence domain protein n=1 Tax=Kluyvera georgiana ATCC 51603 TaxID=1354264 RepID=A0A1B7JXF9_9ENTR|nr:twin-arginine translocation pathway signal sequence domain protein [Kluyvera georgiana ATCC 51603]